MRQRKIDFVLGRVEGANPLEHSAKEFSETHERVKRKIEKRY